MVPKMYKIKVKFDDNSLKNVEDKLGKELDKLNLNIKKGSRIAITAGSRGIDRIPILLKTVVQKVRELGGEPFVVPTMGSHGGATALGQVKILEELGITCKSVGAEILSTMDVVQIGQFNSNTSLTADTGKIPIVMDKNAWCADGVIVMNRVKKHTSFSSGIESGMIKMMVVGLGKKVQAENIHSFGTKGLRDYLEPMAKKILDTKKIVAGIGLVENAYDKIWDIQAFPPDDIIQGEKELLKRAKKMMPALPVQNVDVLIVEEIGKNISGTGMDTNIIGRMKIQGEPEPETPRITSIVVLGLTQETKGNAYGIGLADFTTKAVVDGIDYEAMYANAMASTFVERVKIPVIAPSEEQAIEMAIKSCGIRDYENARVIRIKNTLSLGEVWVSQCIYRELQGEL
jgi:hypothetical protein